jgi:hypothetical protein
MLRPGLPALAVDLVGGGAAVAVAVLGAGVDAAVGVVVAEIPDAPGGIGRPQRAQETPPALISRAQRARSFWWALP